MSRILLLLATLAACVAAPAEKSTIHLNAKIEDEIGYSEAVRVGDTLYVSGTVGAGEMPAAIRQAYNGLKRTLTAAGLTFQDVVKENVYTTNLDDFIKNKDVRKEFYGPEYPAATWVQVQRLYSPNFVVEIEVTAVFPKK